MAPMLRLAENLRYLRLRADFTQEQMAELVGFEFKFYQKLEGGKKPQIKIETVERLGKPFGLEAWQLLAPARIFRRIRVKVPAARSRSQRGPRAKWTGLSRRGT